MTRQVEERAEKGFFETLTGTFKKISFIGQEIHSGNHLSTMNVPHWLAKRDAAYAGVAQLLKDGFAQKPVEQRSQAYTRVLSLLNLAVKAHERVRLDRKEAPEDAGFDFTGEYFKLLTKLLNACCLTLEAHGMMSAESAGIRNLADTGTLTVLEQAVSACMESETRLLESLARLTEATGHMIDDAGIHCMKRLSKLDRDRYEVALEELRNIYRQISLEGQLAVV